MIIGVLGGMGTYATIKIFQQYAEIFPAEKEWDRPRIIIDNNCTMPSRVRAALYKENVGLLVSEMSQSIRNMMDAGCTNILIGCNTAHLFLPEIYKQIPEAKHVIVDIIANCAAYIKENGISKVYLLASEGTIESGIYQNRLAAENIECDVPEPGDYGLLRRCIEAVKQKKPLEKCRKELCLLLNNQHHVILGCTEMPVIFEEMKDFTNDMVVYDPVKLSLAALRNEWVKQNPSK